MKHSVLSLVLLGICVACSSESPKPSDGSGPAAGPTTDGSSVTSGSTTSAGGAAATSATASTSSASSLGGASTVSTSMGGASTVTNATSMGGGTTTVAAGGTTTSAAGAGGSGGNSGCDTLSEAIDQTTRYVLAFGDTYFAAVPAGGKIVEFRRSSGSNLLTGSDVHESNFGATLWTSPQADWDWPPPDELDVDPYTVTVDEATATITMTSAVATSVGPQVSVQKVFAADLCANAVDITYTVTNEGASAASFAAWTVARMFPGGLGFFAGTRSGYDSDVLPATAMDGVIWYDHATQGSTDAKLFADGTGGYLAFTNGTDLFVQAFADVMQGAQAPNESEIELYDGMNYVEYEIQGAYGSVPAAGTASLQVRWMARAFPDGAARETGNAELLSAVSGLL